MIRNLLKKTAILWVLIMAGPAWASGPVLLSGIESVCLKIEGISAQDAPALNKAGFSESLLYASLERKLAAAGMVVGEPAADNACGGRPELVLRVRLMSPEARQQYIRSVDGVSVPKLGIDDRWVVCASLLLNREMVFPAEPATAVRATVWQSDVLGFRRPGRMLSLVSDLADAFLSASGRSPQE